MIEQQMPLVSVIIPVYNAAKFISRAVDSVKCQTYLNWEVIMIDDGSTDNTWTTISKFLCENIKAFQQKNQGPAAARNLGIKKAKGEFITFLDADDEYPENKIEIQAKELIHYPELLFVSGKIKFILNEGHQAKEYLFDNIEEKTMTHVNLGAMMMRKHAFDPDVIGLIDEELIYAEDADWWLRALEENVPFVIMKEVTLWYHLHNNNMTNKLNENSRYFAFALRRSLRRRRNKGKRGSLLNMHQFVANNEKTNPAVISIIIVNDSIQPLRNSIIRQDYSQEKVVYLFQDKNMTTTTNGFNENEVLLHISEVKVLRDLIYDPSNICKFIALGTTNTVWNRKRLNAQVNFLINNPDYDACTCRIQISDSSGPVSGSYITQASEIQSLVVRNEKTSDLFVSDQAGKIIFNFDLLMVKRMKTVLMTKSKSPIEQALRDN